MEVVTQAKFERFMRAVDDECYSLCGMSVHDLPDFDFWSAFEDEKSPKSTASKCVKAAGGF